MVAVPSNARALDISQVFNQVVAQISSFFQSESDSNAAAIAQNQTAAPLPNTAPPQTVLYNPVSGPVTEPGVINAAPSSPLAMR
jgi:hypothetical protein